MTLKYLANEITALGGQSSNLSEASQNAQLPEASFGFAGEMSSAVATVSLGGSNLTAQYSALAGQSAVVAQIAAVNSAINGMNAAWDRRLTDWAFQLQLATSEVAQLTYQDAAAQARIAAASANLDTHDLRISQADQEASFLTGKFTNRDLYDWIASRVSSLYFQGYQLALDTARQAEACYQQELAVDDTFITLGGWDGLRRGLLAGETLHSDLRRMEAAYLRNSAREIELTKTVSLALRTRLLWRRSRRRQLPAEPQRDALRPRPARPLPPPA